MDLKEKAWRFQQESLPFPLKYTQSYVHIHKCVLGKEELQTEPGIVSVPTVWETNQEQRTVNLSTYKNHMATMDQTRSELSPTALLFSQTCRSEC